MGSNFVNAKKKKKGIMLYVFLLLVVFGVGFGGYFFYRKHFVPQKESFTVLETTKVEKGTVQSGFDATGVIQLEAGATVTLSSRVAGVVSKLPIRIGQSVEKGTLLASLDTKDILLAVREGQASVTKAESAVARIRNTYATNIANTTESLNVAKGAYSLAQHAEKDAKNDKNIPEIEKKKLSQAVLQAKVAMDNLESTLKQLKNEYTLALKEAEATLEQAKVQLALSRNQQTYYTIESPIKGTVSAVFVSQGEQVLPAKPVATIIDRKRMNMLVYIDESDIGMLQVGMPVEFSIDSLPNTTFKGNIGKIYPEPELRNGVVYYKAEVPLAQEYLESVYPKMTTQVRVIAERKNDVLRVPNTALQWTDTQRILYKKTGNGFEKIVPKLGIGDTDYTEILEGVQQGDEIATKIVAP